MPMVRFKCITYRSEEEVRTARQNWLRRAKQLRLSGQDKAAARYEEDAARIRLLLAAR